MGICVCVLLVGFSRAVIDYKASQTVVHRFREQRRKARKSLQKRSDSHCRFTLHNIILYIRASYCTGRAEQDCMGWDAVVQSLPIEYRLEYRQTIPYTNSIILLAYQNILHSMFLNFLQKHKLTQIFLYLHNTSIYTCKVIRNSRLSLSYLYQLPLTLFIFYQRKCKKVDAPKSNFIFSFRKIPSL